VKSRGKTESGVKRKPRSPRCETFAEYGRKHGITAFASEIILTKNHREAPVPVSPQPDREETK
jgi:hypothetical protein